MTETIATVVGKNARAVRQAEGLTIEDLVKVARENGLNWSAGRVSHIERGDQVLSVDTLLMVSAVLTEATGEHCGPADLLHTREAVQLSWEPPVTGQGLQDMITGEAHGFDMMLTQRGRETLLRARAGIRDWRRVSEVAGGSLNFGQIQDLVASWTPADDRHREKLGLSSSDYLGWCYRVWGRILSQETERRAPEGATPQKKGRITRELLDELRQKMNEAQPSGDD